MNSENDSPATIDEIKLAYAQAKRYGQDLARIYGQEKAKRQELEIANQKLSAIWATAPNGLAVLDQQMRVTQANPRFEAQVEQSGQCQGHLLTELLPSPDLAATIDIVSREGTPFAEIEVTLAEPTHRTLQITGAPLSAGDQRGWVVSLHDLTERKRLEGLKEEFVDIAAHELRTPLAIILGFASVLGEDLESADAATAAPLDAIVQAAHRLNMIVNELVDSAVARTRSNAEMGLDHFDLMEVTEHTASSWAHQASEAGVEIKLLAASEPLTITGDRVIMAQAIGHLVENAIRFNRPGGQVIVRGSRADDEVILEIEDTGIGIPATDLDNIFDMFYQVEEHMTRVQSGLGMGLAIARRGIELHGGRISVTSVLNQGSCFRLTLPRRAENVLISSQDRLDTAHQQTLAYGRDLARAFAAQRTMTQRLSRVSDLGHELFGRLEDTGQSGTGAGISEAQIEEVRALAQQLVAEATTEAGPSRGKKT
jgi:PAS domain S-box-containing protein